MREYLEIADNVLKRGQWKGNRTGVRTLTLPNQHFSHNMWEGFPALTTKRIAFKTMATELEGFIKGITDKRWYQKRNCKIWSEWSNPQQLPKTMIMLDVGEKEVWESIKGQDKLDWQKENPDLGPLGYSHQWRNFNGEYQPIPFIYTEFDKKIQINKDNTNKHVGKEFSGPYGDFTIIDTEVVNKKTKYRIKFHTTGYCDLFSIGNINKLQVKDPYYPCVFDVACLGTTYKYHNYNDKLKQTWYNMISRCYNKADKDYLHYGANKTYVDNRWLIYSNFLDDVSELPGWNNKLKYWNSFTLDKDYGQNNCYSKENCRWISKSKQSRLTSVTKSFLAISPDNKEYVYNSIIDCAIEHNLDPTSISRCLNSKYKHTNDWTFKTLQYHKNQNDNRYDQFDDIVQKLKNNPDDRRMVCSAWNPVQLDRMALPPCHLVFILTNINGDLHLHWTQRSCDLFLGVPFNIASYALLLELLCKESGLRAGNLSGMLCDCHIYENHIEQMRTQLSRHTKALPFLRFDEDKWTGIYNWEATHSYLSCYDPAPKIQAKVAV